MFIQVGNAIVNLNNVSRVDQNTDDGRSCITLHFVGKLTLHVYDFEPGYKELLKWLADQPLLNNSVKGEIGEINADDLKQISAIWKMPHSERLRHMLTAQYFTFRSMHQTPDVAWQFLGLYRETWMSEHGLDEIAWLSQEMGEYD